MPCTQRTDAPAYAHDNHNVILDGCCNYHAIPADEELHRQAVEDLNRAYALLFGRMTYVMMEAAFRPPTEGLPDSMEPFARTIDAAEKHVVLSTLDRSLGTRNLCAEIWRRRSAAQAAVR